MNAPTPGRVELGAEQRAFFENNGYLVVKGALPPDVVGEIEAAVDEVHERARAAGRHDPDGRFQLRNAGGDARALQSGPADHSHAQRSGGRTWP